MTVKASSPFTRFCVIICFCFSKKNAISPLFCDEMAFFSPFMQFVTVLELSFIVYFPL